MAHAVFELSFTPAATQEHCNAVQNTISSLQGQTVITTTWKCEAQAGVYNKLPVYTTSDRCNSNAGRPCPPYAPYGLPLYASTVHICPGDPYGPPPCGPNPQPPL